MILECRRCRPSGSVHKTWELTTAAERQAVSQRNLVRGVQVKQSHYRPEQAQRVPGS